ncbi:hypothetical protein L1887_34600 [Cichorium endivia]|nr:hypothetical protein L1887_34600 [Cichorium endivia]
MSVAKIRLRDLVAWGSSIRPIYTFFTIEELWSLYNNLHRPSRLAAGAGLHCFKNRIEPKWEDPICAPGGKWTMTFPKSKSATLGQIVRQRLSDGRKITCRFGLMLPDARPGIILERLRMHL